jgi:hypothetical protein
MEVTRSFKNSPDGSMVVSSRVSVYHILDKTHILLYRTPRSVFLAA